MKRKKILKIMIGIISVLLMIDLVVSYYFYNIAINRNGPKDFLQGNADLEVSAEAMDVFLDGDWYDWLANQQFEELELTSRDGLKLRGYYLAAKQPSNKLVVFAHGYLGHGKDMGLFGDYYESLGYNIFMADMRGHGQSEGDYIGFGWDDRLDYVDWIDMLIEKLGPDTEIVLHGLSMGAATVLMTSGEDLPDNVKAVIADSPYTSVHDMFAYQMSRIFHLPSFPLLNTTSLVSKIMAGYSFKEASALTQVAKATVPILYIHGNADTFVPTEMTYELYDHTKSDAEILTIDGAGHGEGFVIARDVYVEKVNAFLGKYMHE